MDQNGNSAGSEKWSSSRYTLKIKLTDLLIDCCRILTENSRMIPRVLAWVVGRIEVKQHKGWESCWVGNMRSLMTLMRAVWKEKEG